MIRVAMRRLILRVLLLVVFLNTAIGVPLHASQHLHGHGPAGPACVADQAHTVLEGLAADDADCHGRSQTEAHAGCTWCLQQAPLALALLAEGPVLPAAQAPPPDWRQTVADPHAPQLQRSRYAARAPPAQR